MRNGGRPVFPVTRSRMMGQRKTARTKLRPQTRWQEAKGPRQCCRECKDQRRCWTIRCAARLRRLRTRKFAPPTRIQGLRTPSGACTSANGIFHSTGQHVDLQGARGMGENVHTGRRKMENRVARMPMETAAAANSTAIVLRTLFT